MTYRIARNARYHHAVARRTPPIHALHSGPYASLGAPWIQRVRRHHHASTNHRIAVGDDRATIRAHIRAEHWIDESLAEGGPACWLVVGFYDDEAVRTPVGWRLDSVRLTVSHQTGVEAAIIALRAGQQLVPEGRSPLT